MRRDRVIGAVALTGALVGGGVAGVRCSGSPASRAPSPTTSEATTTTAAPRPRARCRRSVRRHFGRGPGFSRC